jgi:hypothetical protein
MEDAARYMSNQQPCVRPMHAPARRRSTVADVIQVFGFGTRDLINLLGEDSVSKLLLVPAIRLTNLRIPDQLWGSQTAECLSATAEEGWVDEREAQLPESLGSPRTPQACVPSAKVKWRLEMTEAQVLGSATHASFTSQPMLPSPSPRCIQPKRAPLERGGVR